MILSYQYFCGEDEKCHESPHQNNRSASSDSKREPQNMKYDFTLFTVNFGLPEFKMSGV
jgi:hypothetical protein